MTTTVTPTIAARDLSGPRAWFAQARFGFFIHYGLYSVHGKGEDHQREGWTAKDYAAQLMPRFNPQQFDARQWVKMFQDAGARYCVLTSKHGEGFCLWNTETTDFKVTNTPFARDIVAELAEACREAGLRFGLYFAIDNWHYENSGLYEQTPARFAEFTRRQLEELTTRYGPIDVLWFDGSSPLLPIDALQEIVGEIRERQPAIVINDRGVHHNDTQDQSCGDFVTPERFFPSVIADDAPFVEVCDAMAINSWGWREDNVFWSTPTLISRVSRCASLGANYLLNVEPDASGQIRPQCTQRMEQMGRWNAQHAEAVFDTYACSIIPVEECEQNRHPLGVCTRGGDRLYVLLDRMPATSRILLPGVVGEPAAVWLDGQPIQVKTESIPEGTAIGNLPSNFCGTNPVLTIQWRSDPEYLEPDRGTPASVRIAASTPSVLRASDTALLPSRDGVTWHQIERYTNGSESIGRWVRASSRARWCVDVEAEGEFDVYIDLGTSRAQADAEIMLDSGQMSLTTRSRETGWYGDAFGYAMGRLKLTPGQHTLTLSMKPAKFGPNVHRIVMVPAGT